MEVNGDCLKVSSEKKGLGVGEEEGSLVNQLFKIPRPPIYMHTHKQMGDKVFFFFLMVFREYKIVLKMKKDKIYYIRQVPSVYSAYWFYT